MKNLNITYNMASEVLGGLFRYAIDEQLTKSAKGLGYVQDKDTAEWVNLVNHNISDYLKSEIDCLFKDSFLNISFLQYLIVNQKIQSPDDLFAALNETNGTVYLKSAYDFLELKQGADSKQIKAMLDTEDNEKTAIRMLELINNSDETVERLAAAVKKFYDLFLRPFENKIKLIINEKTAHFIKMQSNQPFIEKLIGTDLSQTGPEIEVRIVISHYFEASLNIQIYPEHNLYHINMGYQIEDLLNDSALEKKREQIFKILSDSKRLKILKLLCKRSYYGSELAKNLNISTATLSYHISKLYLLGVINFEDGESNRIYYKADKEKLKVLFENVYNDIIK